MLKWDFVDYLMAYLLSLVCVIVTVMAIGFAHIVYIGVTSTPEKRECVE